MKHIILTAAIVIISLIIGFILGRQTADIKYPLPAPETDFKSETSTTESATSSSAQTEGSAETGTGATSIETSQLTSEQRALLGTFGIDADALVVTGAMIACAETKIGKARLAEIFAGATPTFFEGADLFSCYQQ